MDDGAAEYAAIVLAGGAARRMGGRCKPTLPVGGRSMLSRVLHAVADARPPVVVGPPMPVPAGVLVTREQPPGGGPVAGIAAGLAAIDRAGESAAGAAVGPAGLIAVLAADQPFLTSRAVRALCRAAATHPVAGAAFAADDRPQLLCGVWQTAALRTALAEVGDPRGVSVRRLLGGLPLLAVAANPTSPAPWYDCDSPDELAVADRWFRDQGRPM